MRKLHTQVRLLFLVLFFGFQVGAIFFGFFHEEDYFNWVPYDEISHYQITATVRGLQLSDDEVKLRYRKPAQGRENRKIENLISVLRQYESTYGKNDSAYIHLTAVINGHKTIHWSWPEDRIEVE